MIYSSWMMMVDDPTQGLNHSYTMEHDILIYLHYFLYIFPWSIQSLNQPCSFAIRITALLSEICSTCQISFFSIIACNIWCHRHHTTPYILFTTTNLNQLTNHTRSIIIYSFLITTDTPTLHPSSRCNLSLISLNLKIKFFTNWFVCNCTLPSEIDGDTNSDTIKSRLCQIFWTKKKKGKMSYASRLEGEKKKFEHRVNSTMSRSKTGGARHRWST